MTHTQGPWRVTGESGNDSESEIIEASDKTIAWTASSYDDVDGEEYISDEDRANATLIAASPLMYEAITRFLYVLEKSDVCDFCTEDENNDHEQSCPVLSLYLALPRATGTEVEA